MTESRERLHGGLRHGKRTCGLTIENVDVAEESAGDRAVERTAGDGDCALACLDARPLVARRARAIPAVEAAYDCSIAAEFGRDPGRRREAPRSTSLASPAGSCRG